MPIMPLNLEGGGSVGSDDDDTPPEPSDRPSDTCNCGCGGTVDGKPCIDWSNFTFELELVGRGEFYVDSIYLFKKEDEVLVNEREGVECQIQIVNPPQRKSLMNDTIQLLPDKVLMDMPPVTVVDYQDNLACIFRIMFNQAPKITRQGDTMYQEDQVKIYESDIFVLNGYMVSHNGSDKPDIINPGIEGSNPRYQLTIGQI